MNINTVKYLRHPYDSVYILDVNIWIAKALTTATWQYTAVRGDQIPRDSDCKYAVAIVAPDGRTVVSYVTTNRNDQMHNAIEQALNRIPGPPSYLPIRAAQVWSPLLSHRGSRFQLAQIACRLLHAHVFEVAPDPLDALKYELWRCNSDHVVTASEDVLAAASAVLQLGDELAATHILAGRPFGKGLPTAIDRPR